LKKVFISPPNSLILYDLVERLGHKPLAMMSEVADRVRGPGLDSPPFNLSSGDLQRALKYCPIEVPSGVRGRLAMLASLIEEAEAAIIVEDPDVAFGCSGCARTEAYVKYLLRRRKIPILYIRYPRSREEAVAFVKSIKRFLSELEGRD